MTLPAGLLRVSEKPTGVPVPISANLTKERLLFVIPAKAGIQYFYVIGKSMQQIFNDYDDLLQQVL